MVGRSNRSGRAIAEFPLARKTVPEKPARLRAAVALEYGNGKPAQAVLKRSLGTKDVLQDRFVCQRCAHRGADVRPHFPSARMGTDYIPKERISLPGVDFSPSVSSGFHQGRRGSTTERKTRSRFPAKLAKGWRPQCLRSILWNPKARSRGPNPLFSAFAIAPVRRRSKMSHIWHALVPIVFNEQTYAGDGHENEHVACSWLSSCRDGSWGCPAGHAGEGR